MAPRTPTPKPIHIFRPGRWVAMSGEVISFTEADLAATAAAYDPAKHRAPIVKGHPATDDPAQGWVQALSAGPRGLFAAPAQVDAAFAEEVRAGRYATVSARFYRPDSPANPVPGTWYLRHLGFLGAQVPGVKGLDAPALDPAFAEDADSVCFTEGVAFGEWDDATNASLWRNLREWLLGKFGAEEADRVLPGYDVRALEQGAQEELQRRQRERENALPAQQAAFSEPPQPQEPPVTEEEAARLRAENEAAQREIQALKAAAAQREAAAAKAESAAFIEGLVSQSRLPEGMAAPLAAVDAHLKTQADACFGEGDAARPLHQVLREFLGALPAAVQFGEHATRQRAASQPPADDVAYAEGADPERIELDKRIRAHMAQHQTSYAAAYAAVTR
ncbi:MAG: peptidase [Pseudomonadota bacterium]|nr:peptidase [Pseudomonadota bacterium]